MRRLLLLRHAKSSWEKGYLDDFSRPLSPRGRGAAPLIGRYISGHDLLPDLVLCSTAGRARQTLELVSAEWDQSAGRSAEVELRASLYLASPGELMAALRRLDDEIESAMIIGHNPGLASLAGKIASTGDPDVMKTMAKKFPTAALAVIDLDIAQWQAIAPGTGHLCRFVRPKDLK